MLWALRAFRQNTLEKVPTVLMGFSGMQWPVSVMLPPVEDRAGRMDTIARATQYLKAIGCTSFVLALDGYHRMPEGDGMVPLKEDPLASESLLSYVIHDEQTWEAAWDYAISDDGSLSFRAPMPMYSEVMTTLGSSAMEVIEAADPCDDAEEFATEMLTDGYSVIIQLEVSV